MTTSSALTIYSNPRPSYPSKMGKIIDVKGLTKTFQPSAKVHRLGLARKASDDEGVYYGVTPRGLEFLDTFWKMKGFLEELGESAGG